MKKIIISILFTSFLFSNVLYANGTPISHPSVKEDCRADDDQCLSPQEFCKAKEKLMKDNLMVVLFVVATGKYAKMPTAPKSFSKSACLSVTHMALVTVGLTLKATLLGLAGYTFFSAYSISDEDLVNLALYKKSQGICKTPEIVTPVEDKCPLNPGNMSLYF